MQRVNNKLKIGILILITALSHPFISYAFYTNEYGQDEDHFSKKQEMVSDLNYKEQEKTNDDILIEKFKPCLVLAHNDMIAPVPVDIMHVTQHDYLWDRKIPKLWVSFYNLTGQYLCERPLFKVYKALFRDYIAGWNCPLNFVTGNYSNIQKTFVYDGKIPESGYANGRYFGRIHPDYGGSTRNDPNSWYSTYQNGANLYCDPVSYNWQPGSSFSPTTYAHVATIEGEKTIQYWFFYPFNAAANNHEGDWEHINVILTSDDPETAEIERVVYYFHEMFLTEYWPPCTGAKEWMKVIDNTHPVVFIGGFCDAPGIVGGTSGYGSHGSYPIYGTWDNICDIWPAVGVYTGNENVYAPNRTEQYIKYDQLRAIKILEPDQYNYNSNPELSWINAGMQWGAIEVAYSLGTQAPLCPTKQSTWNRNDYLCGKDLYRGEGPPGVAGFFWPWYYADNLILQNHNTNTLEPPYCAQYTITAAGPDANNNLTTFIISQPNGHTSFLAGMSIDLKPGFHAEAGSSFKASIFSMPKDFIQAMDKKCETVKGDKKSMKSGKMANDSSITDKPESLPGQRPNVPERTCLERSCPNPFYSSTTIRYNLKSGGKVSLAVYNIMGQKVRDLVNSHKPAGYHAVTWDGTNDDGQGVSRGIYLCSFSTGEVRQFQRVVLAR